MSSPELTRGMLLRVHNDLYQVVGFGEAHTGKQKSRTHVTLRCLRDGHVTDKLLESIQPIEEVPHEIRNMQYLYSSDDEYTFMDGESFEQYTLSRNVLGRAAHFLVESETYKVLCANETPISIQLPDALAIAVKDTAPPAHGVGGASNILKEAVLASGLTVRVPLFIKTGDRIRLDTASEKYVGKESG